MKNEIRQLLANRDLDAIRSLGARRKRVLGVLVSVTYDPDPELAWRAVEAMGLVSERIARKNPEFVRSHLRRLHWLLSEESGGICRHAPQAMAEIVRRSPDLFADYAPIVCSLLDDMAGEDLDSGFRPAILWAIGRVAPVAPEPAASVQPAVELCLSHPDPQVRGLAVWCLTEAGRHDHLAGFADLVSDPGPVQLFRDGVIVHTTVGELAGHAR